MGPFGLLGDDRVDDEQKNLWKTWSFVRDDVKHSVEITEIYFRTILKKNSWNQLFT